MLSRFEKCNFHNSAAADFEKWQNTDSCVFEMHADSSKTIKLCHLLPTNDIVYRTSLCSRTIPCVISLPVSCYENMLASRSKDAQIVGVDIVASAIEDAKENAKRTKSNNRNVQSVV